jgi:predicted dehydrogenase
VKSDVKELRIAVIGCGAVTARAHLPVAARAEGVKVTLLVDRAHSRAETLASQFGVPRVAADYAAAFDEADAAIVALPHCLHASVCVELLRRGIHVLVEKPMALTADECDAMSAAAEEGGAVLAVGLMRRFLRATQFVRETLQAGLLGRVRRFDVREGFVYDWPVASDFFFRKETAGGGVLIDTGAHTLDTLLWWLGDVRSLEYFDDDHGGVEADCLLRLELESGATGVVELSRTRKLRNSAIIEGERASLEADWGWVRLTPRDSRLTLDGPVKPTSSPKATVEDYLEAMAASFNDWIDAIRLARPPAVSGAEARRSIALIEKCYRNRQALELPWVASRAVLEETA